MEEENTVVAAKPDYDRDRIEGIALLRRGRFGTPTLPVEWLKQSGQTSLLLLQNLWFWAKDDHPGFLPKPRPGDSLLADGLASLFRFKDADSPLRAYLDDIFDIAWRFRGWLAWLPHGGGRWGTSFQAHAGLFRSLARPPSLDWLSREDAEENEKWFTLEPLQGANPVVIQKVVVPGREPPAWVARMNDGGDLDTLYVCDFSELSPLVLPEEQNGGRFAFAPRALFREEGGALVSVAVQLGQNAGDLIVRPTDAAWPAARRIVRAANQMHHVLLSHLPRTHFFIESIAVATARTLDEGEPVRRLLEEHFEGTLAFNTTGLDAVDKRTGWFYHLLPGTNGLRLGVVSAALRRPFDQFGLIGDLQARGMCEGGPRYRYRDDGLRYWCAIEKWLKAFVGHYYPHGIPDRHPVRAWRDELAAPETGAGLIGVRELKSKEDLVAILQVIVWTATAGHAAIHNALASQDVFVPAAPNALFSRAPTSVTDATMPKLAAVVPDGVYQLSLNVFGDTRINAVGSYRMSGWPDPELLPALLEFEAEIDRIGAVIDKMNEDAGVFKYDNLHPTRVARSIHV